MIDQVPNDATSVLSLERDGCRRQNLDLKREASLIRKNQSAPLILAAEDTVSLAVW